LRPRERYARYAANLSLKYLGNSVASFELLRNKGRFHEEMGGQLYYSFHRPAAGNSEAVLLLASPFPI
jgi:hypothetical protein